ncbi:MAG: hypothetical protein IIZ54_03660 [Selenomonadaceae bacterium]|nr:hypothetical protein [Selenomonadaceae bacterium]
MFPPDDGGLGSQASGMGKTAPLLPGAVFTERCVPSGSADQKPIVRRKSMPCFRHGLSCVFPRKGWKPAGWRLEEAPCPARQPGGKAMRPKTGKREEGMP